MKLISPTPADACGTITLNYATFIGSPCDVFANAAKFIQDGHLGADNLANLRCTLGVNEDGDYVLDLYFS